MRPDSGRPPRNGVLPPGRSAWLACLLLLGGIAAAQDTPPNSGRTTAAVRSGDPWTDLRLEDINVYAARYRGAFVDELVRYLDAPRPLVVNGIADKPALAGNIYYACAIARVAGQPCRVVLQAWQSASAEGWSAVAAQYGVAPGTAEGARVRKLIEGSYRRWARPPPETPDGTGKSEQANGKPG